MDFLVRRADAHRNACSVFDEAKYFDELGIFGDEVKTRHIRDSSWNSILAFVKTISTLRVAL
jgi:hypothetical protein